MCRLFILISLSVLLNNLSFTCLAEDSNYENSFLKENNLYISVDDTRRNSVTKEQFDEILDRLSSIYTFGSAYRE